jgi:hypothetical protein
MAYAVLALVLVALYWPALDGQVLNWDDGKYLGDPLLQAPLADAVHGAFTTTFDHAWYPLLRLGWWADRGLPRHAIDLALFVGAALVIARVLVELGMRRGLAFTAVLLWAVHPLRVESVAWLTSRKDVQSLFFVALATLGALRGWRVASVALFVAALLSKSLTAPVSVVVAALVWIRERGTWPVALVALALADLAVARGVLAGEPTPWPYESWIENAAVALHAHGDLMRRIVWPQGLAAIYPLPTNPWPMALGGLAVLGLASVAAWRTRPWGLVLLALWVLPLLPVTGMVPLRFWGPDRYTLVAGLAPAICLVLVAGRLAPIAAVLAVPLAYGTRARIPDWHDSTALWERDVSRPGEHWARRVNLGSAYGAAMRFPDALEQYTRAKALAPDRPEVVAHYLFASLVVGGLGGDRTKVGDLLEPYPRTAVGWQMATAGLVVIGEGSLALEAARMARQEGAPEDWVREAEARARALPR